MWTTKDTITVVICTIILAITMPIVARAYWELRIEEFSSPGITHDHSEALVLGFKMGMEHARRD